MGYEKMSTALLPALEDFPEIENTEEVTRQINRFFAPYIFFERHKDSIELWCSCCMTHDFIDNPPRTVTPEIAEVLYGRHNEACICPYCGARATYKNARKLGKKRAFRNICRWSCWQRRTATFTQEHTGRAKPKPDVLHKPRRQRTGREYPSSRKHVHIAIHGVAAHHRPRYKPVEADGDGHCSRCKARCRVRTRLHQGGSNIRRKSFGRGIGHIRRS